MSKLYFDGSSNILTNAVTSGYILETSLIEVKNTKTHEGYTTNNEAEYLALIEGLKKAIDLGVSDLEILGDSQLVVYQMLGRYKVKANNLKPLHKEAKQLLTLIPKFTFTWLARKGNKADAVSRHE